MRVGRILSARLMRLHLPMCRLMCMRTNIEIDDDVLREAQQLLGTATKRDTVDSALREVVARHRRLGVLELRGKVHWEGDLEVSRQGRPG
jgi:Arc/MetJ family transcription regulator